MSGLRRRLLTMRAWVLLWRLMDLRNLLREFPADVITQREAADVAARLERVCDELELLSLGAL